MDNFGAITFLLGLAIPFGWEAVTEAGWRRYGAAALAAIFTLAAIAWAPFKSLAPSLSGAITHAASQPESWLMLFLFASAIIIFTGPQFKKSRSPKVAHLEFPSNLEGRISGIEEAQAETDRQLQSIRGEFSADLSSIKKQIAIEFPNSSNVAEAFKNLDDAVHAKVKRISEQIQGYSDRLNRDNLDLLHTLYSAILYSTELSLLHLISIAPQSDGDENADLTPEAFEKNSDYLAEVSNGLSGTQRLSDFRNVMANAESSADERLKALPRDQWPEDLNYIVTQKYFRVALQRRSVVAFLERQLNGVRESSRNSRYRLVEQYEDRDKRR